MFYLSLSIFWVLASMLCIRAEGLIHNRPTCWYQFPFALICWPLAAICLMYKPHSVLTIKHDSGTWWLDLEVHY
jgi:hypothetical protein